MPQTDKTEIVAQAELDCIRDNEDRFTCVVQIGKPYQEPTGEWACPVVMSGLYERLPDVRGETSLQALCQALSLARFLIRDFVEAGGRVFVPGADDSYPIDDAFVQNWAARPDV